MNRRLSSVCLQYLAILTNIIVAFRCSLAGASLFFPDKETKRQRLFTMMNNVDVRMLVRGLYCYMRVWDCAVVVC
jgi:hypothetical protein